MLLVISRAVALNLRCWVRYKSDIRKRPRYSDTCIGFCGASDMEAQIRLLNQLESMNGTIQDSVTCFGFARVLQIVTEFGNITKGKRLHIFGLHVPDGSESELAA